MSPYRRLSLLETVFALDHLLWCYASEIEQSPHACIAADDICLSDLARRTGAVARLLLDRENQRRGPRLIFTPPDAAALRQLEQAFEARRAEEERRKAADAAEAAKKAANEAPRSTKTRTDDVPDPLTSTLFQEEPLASASAQEGTRPLRQPMPGSSR